MVSCFCFRGNAEIHRLSGGELICFFGAPTRLVSSKAFRFTAYKDGIREATIAVVISAELSSRPASMYTTRNS